MTGNVTADIYRNRKSCYVGRRLLNVYAQCGYSAAESLGSYAKAVYLVQHFSLKVGVKTFLVSYGNVTAECFLRKVCALFKVAADTHSHNHRRTWIAAGF